MTIMNSIPRTLISRHSSLVPRHTNSASVKCRRYHGLSRASSAAVDVDSSTAATQPIFIATTTPAGQSLHFQPIVNYSTIINSLAHKNDAYSSSRRSMVTVTQTSAKSPEELDNNSAAAPIIQHSSTSTTSTDNNNISEDASLTITPTCAARIQQLASTKPNPDKVYLRLYVDAGGCSGFQYKFLLLSEDNDIDTDNNNTEEEEEEDGTIDPEEDIIFHNTNGTRLVIDTTSLDLLRGSTIDYVQEMIRSSFAVVGNPQSESACGCGSSFAVKNFEANPALD